MDILAWCSQGVASAFASPFALAQAVMALIATISFATYFLPWALSFFHCPQDLKKKYGAEWAVVTGGSSGIGLAISKKLARMGLNVVIVAYPDRNMTDCRKDLPISFPEVEWRFVDVNLAASDESTYMDQIEDATKDVAVQVVFSNAGYIKTGLFDASSLQSQLSNLHCNATSSTAVAHHFITKMRKSGLSGCCVFTSSPAMLTPCPLSAMYGATKSFLTELAVSLAPEVIEFGIDVAVIVSDAVQAILAKLRVLAPSSSWLVLQDSSSLVPVPVPVPVQNALRCSPPSQALW
jgi:short-subunit dehydrogenase